LSTSCIPWQLDTFYFEVFLFWLFFQFRTYLKAMATKKPTDPRQRYEFNASQQIGKGAYGVVCKALDKQTNASVAIKIIDLEAAGDEADDVHKEIAVMSNMHCAQLTQYYASYVIGSHLWIVMEYCEGGSLLDIIKEHGPLNEISVAYVMRELLSALAYLHAERKIHRDVKAGNILVSESGAVKLADFGVTGQLTDSIDKRSTKIGTPYWMAPEVTTLGLPRFPPSSIVMMKFINLCDIIVGNYTIGV
jgi:serine/threonine-protein kinase 24/25/MST4